ncbi:MAG TPA: response regulator [Candidatus Limnocylindrales bacterium]
MANILLVDDDAELVARHMDVFEAGGHAVTVADTTSSAIEAARRNPPDAVVLEALLDGGQAGFDLARTLANEFPSMPLLMVTRADEVLTPRERDSQDRDDGWLPVDRYLAKPVMPDVLLYVLDHVLHEPD